jgi:hypothetical protein
MTPGLSLADICAFAGLCLAAFLAIMDYRKQRGQLEQSTPAMPLTDLNLQFDGTALYKPSVVSVRIRNCGAKAISQSDFLGGFLRIFFGNGSRVVSVSPSHCNPSWPKPKFTFSDHYVELEPLLLNPDEYVNFLVVGEDVDLSNTRLEGHLKDVPEIRKNEQMTQTSHAWFDTGTLAVGALVAVVCLGRIPRTSLVIDCTAAVVILLVYYVCRGRLYRYEWPFRKGAAR